MITSSMVVALTLSSAAATKAIKGRFGVKSALN